MQNADSILASTLSELEGLSLQEPSETDTALVRACLALMRVPLGQMTTENLRMLIGQEIGLKYLVPIALRKLALDPFADGDFYAGDLLKVVVGVSPAFWIVEPTLRRALDDVISRLKERVLFLERDIFPVYQRIYGPSRGVI
jgi:hypothetical protein